MLISLGFLKSVWWNYRVFMKNPLKKKLQSFRRIMANNFIQMAAMAGLHDRSKKEEKLAQKLFVLFKA